MKNALPTRSRTFHFAAVLTLLALAAAAPGQEYKIKLTRPSKPGDVFKISAKSESSNVRNVTVGNAAPESTNEKIDVVLEGTLKVLEVNGVGSATKSECIASKCIVNGKSVCEPGDVITAERAGKKKVITIKGQTPDETAVAALSAVMQCADREEKSTDDQLFGSDEPRKVGDTWPVRPQAIAESLAEHARLTVKPEDVHGSVRLLSVKQIDGKDVLSLEMEATLADIKPPLPPTATVDKSGMTIHMSLQVPADENEPPLSQSDAMEVSVQATMLDPDNQKIKLDIRMKNTVDTTIEKVTPGK